MWAQESEPGKEEASEKTSRLALIILLIYTYSLGPMFLSKRGEIPDMRL